MRRLRTALLVAVALLGVTAIVVVGGGTVLLRTRWGNEVVRARIERELQAAVGPRGRVVVGGLTLAPLGVLALDTLEILEADGTVAIATGPAHAEFAIGPLLERELRLRRLTLRHPTVHLVRAADGSWNLARLFADSAAAPAVPGPPSRWRVRLDSLELADGLFTVTRPDSLPSLPPVRSRYGGLQVALGPSRFALGTGVGELAVRRLAADIESPPVPLRHAEGRIALWRDSLALDLPLVRLPATRGALDGTIGWTGRDDGPALALRLRADSVAFTDIAWITPLIPASGRGRAVVRVSNGPGTGVIRYTIDSLDATATDSRLRGRFVADVGDAVAIRDLTMDAAPLDFALLHEVFGDSLPPAPWDGAVRGRLRATGGTLDAWRIDPSTLEFEDRRAGGARSRVTIAGTLDLLAAATRLRPLDVTLDSLDVRTVGAVTEVADSLDGFLRGRVRLDGPVDDLRFSGLDVIHVDGALPRSRVRGEGRLALDTARTWLEARLVLDSMSVAALAKPFTSDTLRGVLGGTLDVSARGDSVALAVDLADGDLRLAFTGATSLDTARLVLMGEARVERFDARRFLRESTLPAHRVTARAQLGIDGPIAEPTGPVTIAIDSTSEVAGLTLRDGRAELGIEPGGIRVDTLAVQTTLGRFAAGGRLSRDPALRELLTFEATIDSLHLARGFLPDSLAEAWRDSLGGRATLRGAAMGSLDTLDISAEWEAEGLRAGSSAARTVSGSVALEGFPRATRGLFSLRADSVSAGGLPVDSLEVSATVREAAWADASIRLLAGDSLVVTARTDIHWMTDSLRARIDSLDATAPNARWALLAPAGVFWEPRRLQVDTIQLRSSDGGRLDLAAQIDTAGPVAAFVRAQRIPMAHAAFTGLLPRGVDGLVALEADVTGTQRSPRVRLTAGLDSARMDGAPAPGLAFRGTYADRAFDIDLRGRTGDRDAFVVTGTLPLDLTFESRTREQRLLKEPLFIRVVADGTSLEGFEALFPGVRELRGAFDADILIGGRWDDLEPRGILMVRDGAFALPALETGFRDLLMDVALAPDSVIIHRARLADERSPSDSASLEGAFARTAQGWRADLRTMARNLRVVDNPRMAEADASWQLRLHGPLDSLLLGGQITIPNGNAYIGGQRRQVLALESELESAQASGRYVPRIEQLTIRLGNEVRLRSQEANVQLTGDIAVTGTLTAPDLRGEVFANRGTYRLDLGLLQRTFQVDSGRVVLNGPAEAAHAIDIHTTYTVRQPERDDVRIGARLTGTTHQPRIVLSSSDLGTTASETEIISYLLFGAPSFALDGQRSSTLRTASAALAPSLGGAVERALGGRLPFISELRVSTVADETGAVTLNSFEGLLNSFKLIAGMQLGPDSFLRVSTGVCRGESAAAAALPVWFGVAAEYVPRERLSAQLSLDPGSSPCRRVGNFGQIYQVGLDLFRDWRW